MQAHLLFINSYDILAWRGTIKCEQVIDYFIYEREKAYHDD